MEDNGELIGEVSKNSLETVKVYVSRFKGKAYVDVRVFVGPDGANDSGAMIATKKGLCLSPELVAEVLPLLSKARKRAVQLGGGES